MNTHISWVDKLTPATDRQLSLLDPITPRRTLGLLDSLTRSFNDRHHPAHMSDSDKKSLLFYQLSELITSAPVALKGEVGHLQNTLIELDTVQSHYRHQHAAGTHSPEGDAEAARRSEVLVHRLHGECIRLRDKAEASITTEKLGEAKVADRANPVLDHFPCLSTMANKARQITLLQALASGLHDLHMMTPQVNYTVTPRSHDRSALATHERSTTQELIDAYYNAGGELAALDPDLNKKLRAQYDKPKRQHTEELSNALFDLSKSPALSNSNSNFHAQLQERLVRDYKFDRRDIRSAQRAGTLTGNDPLQQHSAVLDLVYTARWRELVSKLGDAVYDTQRTMVNPAIKGDPASHVVGEIIKKSAVKVPTAQPQVG